MKNEIDTRNPSKSTTFKSIPTKLLKSQSDLVSVPLQIVFNNLVEQSSFPDELKLADVSPVFKKDVKTFKGNYRSISVLPAVSKVLERLMNTQISAHMSPYLSWLLCGFRKGYNTQHALMRAIEKWKAYLDNGGKIEAIFMDLSKAFDCIRHDLLIAKLHNNNNNNNNTIFSQGNSISYKYSCYQEKPCIELKKLKKIAIHKEEDTKSYKNVKN